MNRQAHVRIRVDTTVLRRVLDQFRVALAGIEGAAAGRRLREAIEDLDSPANSDAIDGVAALNGISTEEARALVARCVTAYAPTRTGRLRPSISDPQRPGPRAFTGDYTRADGDHPHGYLGPDAHRVKAIADEELEAWDEILRGAGRRS